MRAAEPERRRFRAQALQIAEHDGVAVSLGQPADLLMEFWPMVRLAYSAVGSRLGRPTFVLSPPRPIRPGSQRNPSRDSQEPTGQGIPLPDRSRS